MRRTFAFVCASFLLLAVPSAQQDSRLRAAADALDVSSIRTLEYSGVGATFFVGQAYTPGDAWPILPARNYTVSIDFGIPALRVDKTNEMSPVMPLGGGPPFAGAQRVVEWTRDAHSWNVAMPVAEAGPAEGQFYRQAARPGQVLVLSALASERGVQVLLTPHGFVKAAMASKATTRLIRDRAEVSFEYRDYRVTGTLNRQNLVERVNVWVDSPIVGDMLVEAELSGYRDFGGVTFPSRISQRAGGHPSVDVWITGVTANPKLDFPLPEAVTDRPPALMDAQRLSDGVFLLSARGTSSSLVVEMRDHLIVCEANTEEQSLGIISKLKEMFPDKPVRYIVNTHHHWDHSTGLRVYAAAGATIVTHQQNQAWFSKMLAAPRTLNALRRPQASGTPRFHAVVGDKGQLTDGQRVVELHVINGLRHATGMLMVYLPQEKLLFEADAWTPPPGNQPTPPAVVPMARSLYDNIRRLKLDVDRILPNHNRSSETERGRTYPVSDLERAIGANTSS